MYVRLLKTEKRGRGVFVEITRGNDEEEKNVKIGDSVHLKTAAAGIISPPDVAPPLGSCGAQNTC